MCILWHGFPSLLGCIFPQKNYPPDKTSLYIILYIILNCTALHKMLTFQNARNWNLYYLYSVSITLQVQDWTRSTVNSQKCLSLNDISQETAETVTTWLPDWPWHGHTPTGWLNALGPTTLSRHPSAPRWSRYFSSALRIWQSHTWQSQQNFIHTDQWINHKQMNTGTCLPTWSTRSGGHIRTKKFHICAHNGDIACNMKLHFLIAVILSILKQIPTMHVNPRTYMTSGRHDSLQIHVAQRQSTPFVVRSRNTQQSVNSVSFIWRLS